MSERKEMSEAQKKAWEKYTEHGTGNLLVNYFQNKIKEDKEDKKEEK